MPIEARNRYELLDKEYNRVYYAFELGGTRFFAFLLRSLLVGLRPFTIRVVDNNKAEVLAVKRSFRFYFHRADVYQKGVWIGAIKRRFSLINKSFNVLDADAGVLCQIKGALWKPWTFDIIQNKKVYGTIRKSWRGWAGEILTDADNFGIQFPDGASIEEKKVLLAAVFLVDFIYFEGNPGVSITPDVGI